MPNFTRIFLYFLLGLLFNGISAFADARPASSRGLQKRIDNKIHEQEGAHSSGRITIGFDQYVDLSRQMFREDNAFLSIMGEIYRSTSGDEPPVAFFESMKTAYLSAVDVSVSKAKEEALSYAAKNEPADRAIGGNFDFKSTTFDREMRPLLTKYILLSESVRTYRKKEMEKFWEQVGRTPESKTIRVIRSLRSQSPEEIREWLVSENEVARNLFKRGVPRFDLLFSPESRPFFGSKDGLWVEFFGEFLAGWIKLHEAALDLGILGLEQYQAEQARYILQAFDSLPDFKQISSGDLGDLQMTSSAVVEEEKSNLNFILEAVDIGNLVEKRNLFSSIFMVPIRRESGYSLKVDLEMPTILSQTPYQFNSRVFELFSKDESKNFTKGFFISLFKLPRAETPTDITYTLYNVLFTQCIANLWKSKDLLAQVKNLDWAYEIYGQLQTEAYYYPEIAQRTKAYFDAVNRASLFVVQNIQTRIPSQILAKSLGTLEGLYFDYLDSTLNTGKIFLSVSNQEAVSELKRAFKQAVDQALIHYSQGAIDWSKASSAPTRNWFKQWRINWRCAREMESELLLNEGAGGELE